MRTAVVALGIGVTVVLVGCGSTPPKEQAIAAGLVDSGLSKKVADCTAKALVDSLTPSELAELAERGGGGAPVDDPKVTNDSSDKLNEALVECSALQQAATTSTTGDQEPIISIPTSTTSVPPADDAQFDTTSTTPP